MPVAALPPRPTTSPAPAPRPHPVLPLPLARPAWNTPGATGPLARLAHGHRLAHATPHNRDPRVAVLHRE